MLDPRDAFDLTGRAAAITGAGSGIGRASAMMLAGAGAAVACADIDAEAAERTASAIRDDGGRAHAVACDVRSRADVDALVAGTVDAYGRLDVMGNIAGIIQNSLVVDTSEEDLDRVLAVNLKGVFFGCQAAARVMVEQGSGSIVNMASGSIDVPKENLVCYAIAKAGVAQITKTLACEVGPAGVRVNAVAPGIIETAMTSRHFVNADGSVDEELRKATFDPFAQQAALRTVGEPNDIAFAVLYLASDAAKFVTGQVMRPNGGIAMP
jgi:3-oxoacyl-[acyl-carrier protein] reductase